MMKHLFLVFCFLLSASSLMASGTISGIVTSSPLGVPLPAATVTLLMGSDTIIAATTTAADGTYSFSGITAGEYTVRASLLDLQTAVIGVIVQDGQNSTADLSLAADPGAISGQVLDNSSAPISGATINAIQNDILIGSATTDGSGDYTIYGLPSGSYVVTAAATDYQTGTTGAIVVTGQTTTANFSLNSSPGTISGTVTSEESSSPILGALIQVSSGDTVIYSAVTDSSGDYTITGVSPGSYTITSTAATHDTGIEGVVVLPSTVTTVDFSLDSSPGTISGTVTRAATGSPISGALVEVNLGSIVISSAVTDSAGNYSITGVPPGSYIVNAYATNYQTATSGAIVLANETTTVNFSLQSKPGTISGNVISTASGLPISGALVQLSNDDAVIDSTVTDSSGNYSITGVAPGSYSVTATATTYDTGITGAIVSSNQTTTVNFSLNASPGTISGTVISAESLSAISGALVEVRLENTVVFSTLTSNSGDYSISGINPGSYIVHAYATNYQTGTTGAIIVSNETTTVDFSLASSPGTISGTVTSAATGSPISGALVEVSFGSIVIDSAVTDNSGSYSISGVPAGSYIADAYATNYQTGSTGAIVLPNETTTVNFSLQSKPGTISGNVISTASGLPISGALVQVSNEDAVIDSVLTDSSGNYTITGVAPGSYSATAAATTYDTGVTGAIVFSNQTTTVNFSLDSSPGTISGSVVTNTETPLPISGALIEVSFDNSIIFSTVTDSSGGYSISGVSPGSYIVQAYAANYQTGTTGAIVLSNEITTVDFSLDSSPGAISGNVTSATSGSPISGALIEVNSASIVIDSAVTDSAGNYSIAGVPAGAYIVDAYAINYQTGTVGAIVLSSETTTVDFSLSSSPGTLSGTVTSATSGLPIAGVVIEASLNEAVIFSTITDSFGNYSISGIAPGSYVVDAYATNYQSGTSNATLSSNQTTIVNFSLQSAPGTIAGRVTSTTGGSPISGALVEVNLSNVLIFSTLTNSAGYYSISGVAPNTYAAHAHAATYQTAINSSVSVSSNDITTVNFSLASNPGTVQGTITDSSTGLPISGVFISIFEGGVFIDVAVTDSSGNYSVTGLAADDYTFTASNSNYVSNSGSFMISGGGTTTANLALVENFPPRNLTGKVVINGFLLQADRIHRLRWTASLGINVANYRVYRNGALLATIAPGGSLEYDDHNRSPRVKDNYTVTAINTTGNESSALSITLQ